MARAFRRICGLGAWALASLGWPAWAETEHATLALPADVVQFVSTYAAQDLGLWQREGLEVNIVFIAGVGAFNAVISGAADFSISSGAALTRAAAHGQRMLAIANMIDRPPWGVVLRRDAADAARLDATAPLAERARALAGRTIAIDAVNSVAHAYLRIIAKAGGIDPESVTAAVMQPPDMLAALSRKAIDGFALGPPWVQMVEQSGAGVIVANGPDGDPPWLAPIGSSTLIVRPSLCREHRSVCVKMGRAMTEAARLIRERPQDALGVLQKHYAKMDPAVLGRALAIVAKATAVPPVVVEAALVNSDRLNIEAGFLKPEERLTSYEGLYTDEFLR